MCRKTLYLISVLVLSFACTSYTSAAITYVDATEGEAGNTLLATGAVFTSTEDGSGSDNLWRGRAFGNSATIFESGGQYGDTVNTEDCPRLMTFVDVPLNDYEVYVYFWADGSPWRIQASLADGEGDLPLYLANDPNSEATVADANDFAEPVPMLTEGNRTLWQAYLGTTGLTTMITVYIDDDPNHLTHNGRTWYDGIGYEAVAVPGPEPVDPGTEGLVAYYAFENDANDSSGNGLNGTIFGDPNFVEGIAGMALDFDGDGDYIDCGNDPKFDITDKLTVATWVNIRSIPQAWSAVVDKGDSAWRISSNAATTGMHFGFEDGTRGWQAANSATQLNLDEWYHVCGVYDTSVGAKIYINGAEDGSNPDKEGITISTYNVWIGDNSQTSDRRYWDGLIDELKIYDRALSEGEVMYLAGMRPTPVDPGTEGLVAYYAMENDVNDSSGNGLNGTIFGDPNFVAGYEGMALDLDGVGDYVDCGYDPLFDVLTNEITVSAWVTIRSIANQWAAIAAKGEYAWRLGNASLDPRFHFGITIWSAPDTASLDGVTAVGYDEWHHAAGVFDGSNIMVYLDGALDVSVATTEPIGINDKSMFIGDNPDATGRYWDGLIDELKIYDRALSAGELRYLAGFREPVVPVHSYTFEDGTANDSVGDAHGTLVGGAEIVDGAMVTTAQDQWMEMPGDVIAMGTYPEVTIEAWYTPTAGANTGWSMLAYFGDSATGLGNDGYFITSARGDDKSRAAISCGNTSAPYSVESGADGPEYDDGLLHHMVSTLNATDITLYIDGVLMQSTPLSATNSISCISPNFAYLAKGGYNDDPEWIGAIEEFNIYDVALSEAEVAARYAAGPQ
jgi:hypothetical protein